MVYRFYELNGRHSPSKMNNYIHFSNDEELKYFKYIKCAINIFFLQFYLQILIFFLLNKKKYDHVRDFFFSFEVDKGNHLYWPYDK